MSDDHSKSDVARQSRWTWIVPLGLVGVLVGAYFLWPSFNDFVSEAYSIFSDGDQERTRAWVRGFGAWGFVVLVAMMLMQTIIAFLPSLVLMVVSVLAYGPVLGGGLAWGGMLLAASLGFVIGRGLGVAAVDRIIGPETEARMLRFVDRYGTWAVIAARISPVLSTDAVSIVAGMAKMRYVRFVIATGIGTLPLTVLVAWLGADVNRLQSGLIWVSIISIGMLIAYIAYDFRRRRR